MPKIKTLLLVFSVISVLCFGAYANSLQNPFIWDDLGLIVKNPLIQGQGNLFKAFSSDLYAGTVAGSNFYRPLQAVSFIWDYHHWQLDPFGYHLTNILLQVLASCLAFIFIYILAGNTAVAFLSAALFGVSPLNTEAVAYISGRSEMLMGIFLLSAIILFIRGRDKGPPAEPVYLIFSCGAYVLALFSKELSVVFPLILLGYLFYFRRDKYGSLLEMSRPVLPFILVTLAYIFLRSAVFNFATLRPPALTQYPLLLRITVLPKIIFTYFKLLLLPVNLHMSYTVVRPVTFSGFFFAWFILGLICAGSGMILAGKRGHKLFCFLFFWALVFFLPQSGIFPINAFIAEHFIYLPSISFFVLTADFLRRHLRKRLFILLSSGLVIFYGLLTFARNADWQDPFLFYEKIIKFSPDSFQAHNNLGLEYEYRHMFKQAVSEYARALAIRPDLVEARSNLANVYFKTGRLKEAREEYALLKKTAPALKLGEIENNIGCIYEAEGLWDEALEYYRRALALDPKLNFAHFNLAKIYQAQGRAELSAREILDSLPEIKVFPPGGDGYLRALNRYLKKTRIANAPAFYNDLGIEFAAQDLSAAARVSFKRSLELEPRNADVYFNLGLSCWNMGLKKEAVFALRKALKINPNHLRAKGFLSYIIRKK